MKTKHGCLEQIANNSKESSIQSTNQIRETGKEVAKIRKEAAIASQKALAEGLNSLAMGLSAVQQQQIASDQRLKQQAKAIEEQNSELSITWQIKFSLITITFHHVLVLMVIQ